MTSINPMTSPAAAAAHGPAQSSNEHLVRRFFPAADADAIIAAGNTPHWILPHQRDRSMVASLSERLTDVRGILLDCHSAKQVVTELKGFIQAIRALRTVRVNGQQTLTIAPSLVNTHFAQFNSLHYDQDLQVSVFVREAVKLVMASEGVGTHCADLIRAASKSSWEGLAGRAPRNDPFALNYKYLPQTIDALKAASEAATAPAAVQEASEAVNHSEVETLSELSKSWHDSFCADDSDDSDAVCSPAPKRQRTLLPPPAEAQGGAQAPQGQPPPLPNGLHMLLAAMDPELPNS